MVIAAGVEDFMWIVFGLEVVECCDEDVSWAGWADVYVCDVADAAEVGASLCSVFAGGVEDFYVVAGVV